jgi:hypothetical protein
MGRGRRKQQRQEKDKMERYVTLLFAKECPNLVVYGRSLTTTTDLTDLWNVYLQILP